jgi:hypothetical protein
MANIAKPKKDRHKNNRAILSRYSEDTFAIIRDLSTKERRSLGQMQAILAEEALQQRVDNDHA